MPVPLASFRFRLGPFLYPLFFVLASGMARPQASPLQALVFSKRLPGSTEPYAATDSMLASLGRAQGFAVRFTRDSTLFQDDSLRPYKVIVWNNVMRNVLSPSQQQAFQRYMENGGGFMGFHAAATNRRLWPWYVDDFLGGDNYASANIAWGQTALYADTLARPGHETGAGHFIMRGVPTLIPQYGEWYRWNPDPAANPAITVLQWYQPRSIDPTWPKSLPASWCREYGTGPVKGRLFYIQVSHRDSIYASAWYRTMAGNALKWVTHRDAAASLLSKADGSKAKGSGMNLAATAEEPFRIDGRSLDRQGSALKAAATSGWMPPGSSAPR